VKCVDFMDMGGHQFIVVAKESQSGAIHHQLELFDLAQPLEGAHLAELKPTGVRLPYLENSLRNADQDQFFEQRQRKILDLFVDRESLSCYVLVKSGNCAQVFRASVVSNEVKVEELQEQAPVPKAEEAEGVYLESIDCGRFYAECFEEEGATVSLIGEQGSMFVTFTLGRQEQVATKALHELDSEYLKYPAFLNEKYCMPILGQDFQAHNDLGNLVQALLRIRQYAQIVKLIEVTNEQGDYYFKHLSEITNILHEHSKSLRQVAKEQLLAQVSSAISPPQVEQFEEAQEQLLQFLS